MVRASVQADPVVRASVPVVRASVPVVRASVRSNYQKMADLCIARTRHILRAHVGRKLKVQKKRKAWADCTIAETLSLTFKRLKLKVRVWGK